MTHRPLAGGLALVAACTSGTTTPETSTGDSGTAASCAYDEDSAQAPVDLEVGVPTEGFLCPRGDLDWYRLTVPPEAGLLQVTAALDALVSPVQVTWSLFAEDGKTSLGRPQAGEAALAGVPLTVVHAVDPGVVLVQVRDLSNDGEDIRHPYTLTVTALEDADPGEPNGTPELAVPLVDTVQAYVSARGDHDWYAFEAEANSAATLRLSSAITDYEPRISVHAPDGTVVLDERNPAGTVAATDLLRRLALEQAGTWRVLVQDDDDLGYDLDTPYQLSLALGDDPDANEPNDHPAAATGLVKASCGGSWSAVAQAEGYLATSGDIDWYALDLTGCGRGLVDAEVQFASSALPPGFEAELRVVRAHANSVCKLDQDCTSLNQTCTTDEDCATVGSSCGLDGYCEGAGVCLPGGRCGANLLIERAPEEARGAVDLRAPLFDAGDVWLGVSDERGDAHSPDVSYEVRAQVRKDPDVHEPNNLYTAGPPTSAQSSQHDNFAVEIPVHNCVAPPVDSGGTGGTADTGKQPEPMVCCTDVPWTEGWLSYDYDQDWFRYAHPCPGEDCMVRLHVDIDGGPVDTLVQVWRRASLWYDGVTGVTDLGDQGPIDVAFGGLAKDDVCFYAFQGHSGSPYWYHVSLRDTIFAGGGAPDGGTWDSSASQRYRLCVEKIADGCQQPCKEYENGCGQP